MIELANKVQIADFWVGKGDLVMIAGPCVIESAELTLAIARTLKDYAAELNLPLIFKASFDKANRTSLTSYRGPGLKHGPGNSGPGERRSGPAGPLGRPSGGGRGTRRRRSWTSCRSRPFSAARPTCLVAAAETGKAVNIKKGQFMAPWDMGPVVDKVFATGNRRVLLTERGAMFGYNNLVVDFRSLPILRGLGCPVVLDVTHSVQLPGGKGTCSGGQREYIPLLARAGVAAGVDALFMEVHPDPDARLMRRPQFPAPGRGPAPVASTGGAAPVAPGAGVTGFRPLRGHFPRWARGRR